MINAARLNTFERSLENGRSPFVPVPVSHRAAIIVLYMIVFALTAGGSLSTQSSAFMLFLLALVVNYAIQLLPIAFYQAEYGWFHPLIFGVCRTLIAQIRGLPDYLHGIQGHMALSGWSSEQITLLVAYAMVLTALGQLAYYCGFFYGPIPRVPRVRFHRPRHLTAKALTIVLLSVVVFALYMMQRGGVTAHLLSWRVGRHEELMGTGYWNGAIRFGVGSCLVWFAVVRRAYLNPLWWICFIGCSVTYFLATGSRGDVVYFIIIALLVWMLRQRKIAPTKVLVIATLAVLIIGVLGQFRSALWSGQIRWDFFGSEARVGDRLDSGAAEISSRTWARNGLLPVLALVPNEVDLLYGKSYLDLLVAPIPRAIWSGKPRQIGGSVGKVFFGTSAATPPGPVGEAYWNLHIPGVILAFFLFGTFHRWLVRVFQQYSNQSAMILLYATVLLIGEGSSAGIIALLIYIIPLLLILRITGLISFGRARAEIANT